MTKKNAAYEEVFVYTPWRDKIVRLQAEIAALTKEVEALRAVAVGANDDNVCEVSSSWKTDPEAFFRFRDAIIAARAAGYLAQEARP